MTGQTRRWRQRTFLVVGLLALVALAWLAFRVSGRTVTIQKVGGWTHQTEPVDFSPVPGGRTVLETFPAGAEIDRLRRM